MKVSKILIEISEDGNVFLKYKNIEEDVGTMVSEPITPDRVGTIVEQLLERNNILTLNYKVSGGASNV